MAVVAAAALGWQRHSRPTTRQLPQGASPYAERPLGTGGRLKWAISGKFQAILDKREEIVEYA
jgi:hypothetical protein